MSSHDPVTIYSVYVTDNKYSEDSKRLIYSPSAVPQGYTITNAKITMEINKIGSFEFTLPRTNPEFDNVKSMESCVIVERCYYNDTILDMKHEARIEEIWRGRVISRELDFYANAQIICEGILGALRDHILIGGMKALTDPSRWQDLGGITVARVLQDLTSVYNTEDQGSYNREYTGNKGRDIRLQPSYKILTNSSHPINKNDGIFKIEQYEETDNINCLDALDMLLEKYPIFLRGKDASYGQERPLTMFYSVYDDHDYISNQKIEFGSNMLDLSEAIDFSSIYTLMWAFGKENKSGVKLNLSSLSGFDDGTYSIPANLMPGVEIGQVYSGPIIHKELVNLYGYIEKVMDFPEISTATELRDKAIAKFSKDIDYSVQINLKAIDLSLIDVDYNDFQVGDFVRVISIPHGINTNTICSKIVLDLGSPSNNEYTFGLNFKSLTDRQVKTDKQNAQLYDAAKNSVYQEKEEP